MRSRRSLILMSLALPVVLMQLDLSGCLPGVGGDGGGGGTTLFNVPPTVVLTADIVRGIAPLTVRFSSAGSTDDGLIVSRLWNFDDGQTSRDISPVHTFQDTGEFIVRITLTDDDGASSSRSIVISVTEAPIAVISVDRTSAASAPAIFNFDGSASMDPDGTIERYHWDFGDGSSELVPVVVHTFATPGTYRVRLTVTDDKGVTGSNDKIIQVGIPQPTITFRRRQPTSPTWRFPRILRFGPIWSSTSNPVYPAPCGPDWTGIAIPVRPRQPSMTPLPVTFCCGSAGTTTVYGPPRSPPMGRWC